MPQCTCCSICCGVLTVCQIVPAIILYFVVGATISEMGESFLFREFRSYSGGGPWKPGRKDFVTEGTIPTDEGLRDALDREVSGEYGYGQAYMAFLSLDDLSTECSLMMKVGEEDRDACETGACGTRQCETAFTSLSVTFSCQQSQSPDCGKFPTEVKVEKHCTTTLPQWRVDTEGTNSTEPEYFQKVATFQGNVGTHSASQEDIIPFRKEGNIIGSYGIQADTEMYAMWEWPASLLVNTLANMNFYFLLVLLLPGGVCCLFTGCIYQKSGSSAGGATGVQMAGQPMMQEML